MTSITEWELRSGQITRAERHAILAQLGVVDRQLNRLRNELGWRKGERGS